MVPPETSHHTRGTADLLELRRMGRLVPYLLG